MSKFVVVVFPEETKVHEAKRGLAELHAKGWLTLYAMAVVAQDADGNVAVKEAADAGPLGTAVGVLTGGLIGLLGGPVGAGVGVAAGALVGSWADLSNLGVSTDFLEEIRQRLMPGKAALVAEVDEMWVTPLDTRMEALGGLVIREERVAFEEHVALRQAEARKAELMQLQAEYAHARETAQAKLRARVEASRASLQAAADRAAAQIGQRQKETEEKIGALQQQAAEASADAKAMIGERVTKLRAEHDRRVPLLKQAAALAQDALKPQS